MKKKKNTSRNLFIFLFMVLIAIIIYNLCIMYKNIDITNEKNYRAERTSLSTDYIQTVDNEQKNSTTIADILEDINNSVVGISKLTKMGGSILNNISSDELGLGTGIIVSENGYILSNSHVTGEKYSTCYVTINEESHKGTVVWSDPNLDLSIIKVKASNLKYVTLGDSAKTRIGQQVYAIGNPIGFEFRRTVTSGIISALNRTIKIEENEDETYISDLIQTDATINPGNSGGPLINSQGEVIGINTVKITSAEGIGFAIPINVIKPVVESYIEKNEFNEATLGVYAYDGDIAKYMELKNRLNHGVYVTKITINSPAYDSELKEGDLITSIDGNSLKTINDLRGYIYTKSPGDIVVLNVIRGDKNIDVEITLGKK